MNNRGELVVGAVCFDYFDIFNYDRNSIMKTTVEIENNNTNDTTMIMMMKVVTTIIVSIHNKNNNDNKNDIYNNYGNKTS